MALLFQIHHSFSYGFSTTACPDQVDAGGYRFIGRPGERSNKKHYFGICQYTSPILNLGNRINYFSRLFSLYVSFIEIIIKTYQL